jgi:hypothetical protein
MYAERKTVARITTSRAPQIAQLVGSPDVVVGVAVAVGVGVARVGEGVVVGVGVVNVVLLQLRVKVGETSITKEGVSLEYMKTLFLSLSIGSLSTIVTL